MVRKDVLVLRVFAGWTLFVWGVLIRNMLKDSTHTLGFRVVHITLALISICLAIAAWRVSSRIRARAGSQAGSEEARVDADR